MAAQPAARFFDLSAEVVSSRMRIALEHPEANVVLARFPSAFDEADFAAFQEEWLRFMDEADHFVTILDVRDVEVRVAAPMRSTIVAFINEVNARSQGKELATIYVIDSPLIRRTATAIFWFTEPECPRHVVKTVEEAVDISETTLNLYNARGRRPDEVSAK